MNRWKLYTGPTLVNYVANRLRTHGVNVTVEGTEHVYLLTDLDRYQLLNLLPTWQPRDLQLLGGI